GILRVFLRSARGGRIVGAVVTPRVVRPVPGRMGGACRGFFPCEGSPPLDCAGMTLLDCDGTTSLLRNVIFHPAPSPDSTCRFRTKVPGPFHPPSQSAVMPAQSKGG